LAAIQRCRLRSGPAVSLVQTASAANGADFVEDRTRAPDQTKAPERRDAGALLAGRSPPPNWTIRLRNYPFYQLYRRLVCYAFHILKSLTEEFDKVTTSHFILVDEERHDEVENDIEQ
jgi:hypothetical protein